MLYHSVEVDELAVEVVEHLTLGGLRQHEKQRRAAGKKLT